MQNEMYMQRCLDLAKLGAGNVSPNPMVGCVVVADGEIIGEGFHKQFGTAHAEVNAINAVFNKFGPAAEDLLKRSSIYVNLEPCAHFGKTPPCADLLIKHHVKEVFIGNIDPFPSVNGSGIDKLRNAGIQVQTGLLKKECEILNKRFFIRIAKQRPYVILKWAETNNGYFAPADGSQKWISGNEAALLTHKWRTEEDAILVGKKTVQSDNPKLTARLYSGKNPIRIVIDKNLNLHSDFNVFNEDAPTLIFNEIKTESRNNLQFISVEDMQYYLPQKIMFQLYLMDIQSVIIEGGKEILNQFIEAGLWDEARVFKSRESWSNGILAPSIGFNSNQRFLVGNDVLTYFYNKS